MRWNEHSDLKDKHSFLSASRYSWINYDDNKVKDSYKNYLAVERGTMLHDFAKRCIDLRQRLPDTGETLNTYVNDAITFKMKTEQVLYFSPNAFATADAICFDGRTLRIHDLKTGKTPASMHQLEIYASYFCLEYQLRPSDINIIALRIYQNNDILTANPDSNTILHIMDKIIHFDKIISNIMEEFENGNAL